MSLESATYVNELVSTNPLSSDPRSDGDDHIRLLKAALKATFPNLGGAVTATHTELNFVDGVTSAIQTQFNTINTNKPNIAIGVNMLFFATAAPTGWTQNTSGWDHTIKIVGGAGGATGGSVAFSTAFASRAVTGTVGGHALTIAEMPSHNHSLNTGTSDATGSVWAADGDGPLNAYGTSTQYTGGGAAHSHSFTGTAINLAVYYATMILCWRAS